MMPAEEAPGTAVTAPPAQVVDADGMAATVTVAGSVSVNAAVVSADAVWLESVTVSCELPPCAMLAGLNALLIEVAAIVVTLTDALPVLATGPPSPVPVTEPVAS